MKKRGTCQIRLSSKSDDNLLNKLMGRFHNKNVMGLLVKDAIIVKKLVREFRRLVSINEKIMSELNDIEIACYLKIDGL